MEADIVEIPKHENSPFDVIIGVETMRKMGIVLDFDRDVITVDGTSLPMGTVQDLKDPKQVMSIYMESLEPAATKEATNRAVKILDANYRRLNSQMVLQAIVITCQRTSKQSC